MPLIEPLAVLEKVYDYVVIGGGTAGLTAASRLSEDPTITVLVLEAGDANFNDPNILVPGQFGRTFGNPQYDWAFKTVKQEHSNEREIFWPRGKGLGGSSTMNFYCWVKPPAADINAFEKLGNPGWNWADYDKFSKKVECYHPPAKEQTDLYPLTFNPNFHGTTGPIHTTMPPHAHTIAKLFHETLDNKGLKAVLDPYDGDINGSFISFSNLDPKTWTRSYAATGYLQPYLDRENLHVVTKALVSRIIFSDARQSQDLIATGVEFIAGNKTLVANVGKEVLLSAGAINDPKILELSGIGGAETLKKIGVEQKIDLPGVGENVQEHNYAGVSFELQPDPQHLTLDLMADPEYAAEALKLHALGKGILRLGITSFCYIPLTTANPKDAPALIADLERDIEARAKEGLLPPGLREQLELQLDTLKDESVPELEFAFFPGFFTTISKPEPKKQYVTLFGFLNHPFSRGNIHAASSDPTVQANIDPRYFENDFDLETLVQSIKYIRSIAQTEPWKSGVVREIDPGPEVTSDEDIRDYIKNNHSSTWHTIGSCSMLPREKRGVVDPKLKVYGTTNLRVADLAIVPLHICAHTQVTAYVIGEKVADIIKSENAL